MRSVGVLLAAAALGLSSGLLVACGDREGLIPADQAGAMEESLDQAASDLAAEECRRAQADVREAIDQAQSLPADVDPELRRNLEDGLAHVAARVSAECGKQETTATTPTVTQTTPTEPPHTETEPPPSTQPTPSPPPTVPAPPPDSGGTLPGDGNGNGNGSGGNGAGNGGNVPGGGGIG